ncbi:MAG: hypothetical protein Q9160_006349 [Pyrenula sp. 1 TL-2023]
MRHEEKYTAILWLNANNEDSLKLSFRAAAQQILKYHPSINVLNGVNLDDLNQLSSRYTQGYRIYIQKFLGVQEALEILSNTSGRKDIIEEPAATELVKELDGLPLALSTAGVYLEHVTTSFSEYLQLYRASWLKLQQTSPQLSSYGGDRSLFSTWQITFDRIEQQNAKSAKLLKLWAYFDRQDVWFELLRHGNSSDEEWLRELTKDDLSFNEAVRLLRDYGLVDADLSFQQSSGSGGLDVKDLEWALDSFGNLYANQGKLTEAEAMYTRALQGKEEALGSKYTSTLNTVNNLGNLYKNQGKLAEAEAMYTWALQGKEEALGSKHTSTLQTVNNLGLLYADQGKLAEAEAMYTRALQGNEEALGSKHTSTLQTVNNLGSLYANQGKLAEAEAMYTRALQGYEEACGPEHVSLYLPALSTMSAFGDLFSRTDRKDLAKVMYSQASSGYAAIQGPSSKWCRQLEDRLQALQSESAKSKGGQDKSIEIGALKSRSLKQKLYKLGSRLKVG